MNKNKKICLIIGIVAVVITIIGGIGFYLNTNKKPSSNNNEAPVNNVYEEFKHDGTSYGITEVCKGKDREGYIPAYNNRPEDCERNGGEIIEIPHKSYDGKFLDGEGKFVLFRDNGLKIWDVENKKYMKVNLEDEYSKYELHLNSNKDTVKGIIYSNSDPKTLPTINVTYGYYNIKQNKKLYNNKYNSLTTFNEEYLVGTEYLDVEYTYNGKQKRDLLSSNEEKINISELAGSLDEDFKEEKGFILYVEDYPGGKVKKIYTNDLKMIVENDIDYDKFVITPNKTLYNLENDVVRVYNSKGNVIEKHQLSGDVIKIFDNHYLVKENGSLYIRDYSNYELKIDTIEKDKWSIGSFATYGVGWTYKEDKWIFPFWTKGLIDDKYDLIIYTINPKTEEIKIEYTDDHI